MGKHLTNRWSRHVGYVMERKARRKEYRVKYVEEGIEGEAYIYRGKYKYIENHTRKDLENHIIKANRKASREKQCIQWKA